MAQAFSGQAALLLEIPASPMPQTTVPPEKYKLLSIFSVKIHKKYKYCYFIANNH
jgi:hypothetical protein